MSFSHNVEIAVIASHRRSITGHCYGSAHAVGGSMLQMHYVLGLSVGLYMRTCSGWRHSHFPASLLSTSSYHVSSVEILRSTSFSPCSRIFH